MKVCFVAANHPPEALGGTEQVLVALARELRARGCGVEVVCGSDLPHDGVDVAAEEFGGVRVHRVRRLPEERDRFRFVWPRLQAVVRGAVERIRPDVVHVHGFGALGLGLVPQLRGLRLPVALTFHDLWATCARYFRVPVAGVVCPTGADREPCVRCIAADAAADPAAVREALARRDQRLQAEVAAASALIAPSATAARFVRDCLPCERPIEVVPHGLLRPTPASERAAAPQPGERLRIGTFGGLVAEKGVLELLAAARGLPCELHLSGRVYDDAIAERLAAARADGVDVRVHGPYTAADPHPARRLHLAVFPSKCQETYGLVVDEALAHGVPVVCSDAGALAERRGTGGVVVAPIADLPATLRGLVTSPDRLAALRAAIPSALPTIAASADRHLALYRSLR